jgi:putative transposase
MAIARRDLVDRETPGFYHCTNRCVRRAFLCGFDEATGQNFDHRKTWLEKRIFELSNIFSLDIYAYAVIDRFLLLQNRHTVLPWT